MAFDEAGFNDLSPGLSGTDGTSMEYPAVSAPAATDFGPSSGGVDESGFMGMGIGSQASPSSFNLATAGLNIEKPRTRAQEEQDYLQKLPTLQKIGLALEAFSAGVAGRENPVDKLLKNRREEQRAARQELMDSVNIMTKGLEESRKYDPTSLQGKAVLAAYKKLLPPELAGALDAVGTENEDQVRSLTGLVSDPDVQSALVKACGRDRACWTKQVNDKDWLATQYATVDMKRMAQVLPKLRAFKDQIVDKGALEGIATKGADGKWNVSWPQMVEGNSKLKIFSDAEMDTFRRNPEYLIPYGIKTTKGLAAGEIEAAKQAEKPVKEWSDPYRLDGVLVQKNEATGEIRTAVSRPPRDKDDKRDKPISPAQVRSDEKKVEARDFLTEHGIDWQAKDAQAKYFALQKKLGTKEDREGKDSKDYDPKLAAELQRAWRTAPGKLYEEINEERKGGKPSGKFDADGSGYDEARASAAGLKRDSTGHMGSVAPTTAQEREKLGLPKESYVLLKGKGHETFDKAVAGEEERGFKVVKKGDRYYSVPKDGAAPKAEPKADAPAKGASLSGADRQKAVEAATAAVNAGADPEAVKKRLKEKYGIEVTFTSKKK